ncbi:hypothetical protein BKA82DRAFT_22727 [Pisolithus tinctorius]|uniref:Uncharacterized protein n=1 Tax=Pisolithus tinctorius Marx 270 TaxID=870435 RepID=A0A0C3PJY2_PISTI|nr:hypothetical protein BKA82DRAFT_22727 [Pisolithus tinctorius]KIO08916.1 hypothetical protein M404DRAFT_22727 [Pisolithus tinctorius Marx 270]
MPIFYRFREVQAAKLGLDPRPPLSLPELGKAQSGLMSEDCPMPIVLLDDANDVNDEDMRVDPLRLNISMPTPFLVIPSNHLRPTLEYSGITNSHDGNPPTSRVPDMFSK